MTVAIAVVALVAGGRILLGHRHPRRRRYPDRWDLVGGHVEPGEQPVDAARRECREEIGVDVRTLRPFAVVPDDPALLAHAFLCTSWTGRVVNAAPEEHDALGWFTAAELAALRLAHASYRERLALLLAEETSDGAQSPDGPRSVS